MAKRPAGYEWPGFDDEQRRLLNMIDTNGNNGWAPNSHANALMPKLLQRWADSGRSFPELSAAMAAIGYDRGSLHQLSRWESKRTTGKFGR